MPADVLPTVARKAGSPSRGASHLLSDAYGPLDCGLCLDGFSSIREPLAMAAADPLRPHHFDHITPTGARRQDGPKGSCPPSAPPCQGSRPRPPRTASGAPLLDLAALAPLMPRLTALPLPASSGDMGARIPVMLAHTGLRSLALPLHSLVLWPAHSELHALSCFRHLQSLEWLGCRFSASDSAWLPQLRVLGGLTSLLIRPAVDTWDAAAVDTLRTGFPSLAALALCTYSVAGGGCCRGGG
jgi:hypothetical protein